MNHEIESIAKILDALKVDSVKDVIYTGQGYGHIHCICGQPIKHYYIFYNTKNNKKCYVGKTCYKYFSKYIYIK